MISLVIFSQIKGYTLVQEADNPAIFTPSISPALAQNSASDTSEPELALQTPNLPKLEKGVQIGSIFPLFRDFKLKQQMGNLTQYTFLFSLCSPSTFKELGSLEFKTPKLPMIHNQLTV